MKKIFVVGFVFCFLPIMDSLTVPGQLIIQQDTEWSYMLTYGDVQQEIRRRYVGESPVSWADGFSGQQFVSQVLTVYDGFRLPAPFLITGKVSSHRVY